jgi:hypothetical protein
MQRRAERISVSRGKNVSKTGISRAVSKWSHEKPTVAGWYWYRGPLLSDPDDEPIVVKVYDVDKLFYAGTWPDGRTSVRVELAFGEWCGPIEPPK